MKPSAFYIGILGLLVMFFASTGIYFFDQDKARPAVLFCILTILTLSKFAVVFDDATKD